MNSSNNSDNEFIISIKGLPEGRHAYEFNVGHSLFEYYGNTQVSDADVCVKIEVEKGRGWMNVTNCSKGTVTVECDRCLDDLLLDVDFTASMAVKFSKEGAGEVEADDEFLIVNPSDGELDLRQFIYDYICINMPVTRVHKEGECNAGMIDRLKMNSVQESTEGGNLPFEGLNELLDKK